MIPTLLAVVIAAGIPALFLLLLYTLDLYASRTFALVLICFLWGALGAFAISLLLNSYVAYPLLNAISATPYLLLVVAVAPLVEEIAKSLSLFYVARRSEFTYFIDGAIYGFAAGIGFSIIENFLYISRSPQMGLGLALTRAFSTCLMHGAAAALVGAAVGRARFQKLSGQGLGLAAGWGAAIALHALFNGVTQSPALTGVLALLVPVLIGVSGVGLIGGFIMLGLREQRRWFTETLDRKVGVSGAEVRAAQAYASLEETLEPLTRQFPQKSTQVRDLILKQAQLGIKRKVQQKLEDPTRKAEIEQEIERMQQEMEQLRKAIGPYVMLYVRGVFPEGARNLWASLDHVQIVTDRETIESFGQRLSQKAAPAAGPARSIFGAIPTPPRPTSPPETHDPS